MSPEVPDQTRAHLEAQAIAKNAEAVTELLGNPAFGLIDRAVEYALNMLKDQLSVAPLDKIQMLQGEIKGITEYRTIVEKFQENGRVAIANILEIEEESKEPVTEEDRYFHSKSGANGDGPPTA